MKDNINVSLCKGIAIILMVFGHSCSGIPYSDKLIVAFHMPLFFFFSGFCLKDKHFQTPQLFVWKRIKGIYWPYVKYSLLFLVLHNFLFDLNFYSEKYGYNGIVSHLYTSTEFKERAMNIIINMTQHDQLLGGYWFLNALFYASIYSFAMLWVLKRISIWLRCSYVTLCCVGLVMTLVLLLLSNQLNKTFTIFLIGPRVFLASMFYLLGHIFRQMNMKGVMGTKVLALFIVFILLALIGMDGMSYVRYNSTILLIPYIIGGLLGTWILYSVVNLIRGEVVKKLLVYAGNNSMTILTWHFLMFK